ncbi:MAG TPA: flagellar motor switch protein FliG [Firmicutes bacterium]|nr:flagellar motor switch protein FliG [Bacillota bacterium]
MTGAIELLRAWLNEERVIAEKTVGPIEYDGVDKVARLLITLGKTMTADAMKFLTNEEVIRIAHVISSLRTIPHNQMYPIVEEFSQMMETRRFMSAGGFDFAREALIKALGSDRTEEVMFKIKSTTRQRRPFDVVRKMEPTQLLNALMDEHPQTIALVLCYLAPDKAAKIISDLPDNLQSDVAMRIGLMNNTSSQIVEAVESVIETRLQSLVMGDMTHIGGLNTVVDILNAVDRTTQKQILQKLSEENPKLAEEVRDNLFTFEDIVILDKVSVQRVIREVDQNKLALALKGASDTVNNLIMTNISVRAAEKLREEIDYLGPVRLMDVELAQQEIVNTIRRLEDAGEIVISRGEENEVIY